MGFSQKAVLDIIESGHKIDVADLLILRWFADFSHTGKMTKMIEGNDTYYWINYQTVLDDLPILNIGKRMLAARLQKMVDAGILKSILKKSGGIFTMYGFGDKYEMLISDSVQKNAGVVNKFTEGVNEFTGDCKNIDKGYVKELAKGMSINLQTKDTSIIDISTKDISIKNNIDCSDVSEVSSTSPTVISFPTNKKDVFFNVTEEHVKQFQDCYQAVDITYELKKMKLWLESNPRKRKTKNGMMNFINSWLGRAQDRPQKDYNTNIGYQQGGGDNNETVKLSGVTRL